MSITRREVLRRLGLLAASLPVGRLMVLTDDTKEIDALPESVQVAN